jgi:hypothetical protein
MPETIPVIEEAHARDTAEQRGYNKFADMDAEIADDADPTMITDSAWWANHELPRLRAMAGADDHKGCTYTDHRDIALIPGGCGDDRPAEVKVVHSRWFFGELVDNWFEGAYRAIEEAKEDQEGSA